MRIKLLLILFLTSIILSAQIKVGFVNFNNAIEYSHEVKAAYEFLKNDKAFKTELVNTNQILNSQFSIHNYKIIWIHHPDSTELTKKETDVRFISSLKNYIKNGGNLFLTLDAMKYLNALGLEKVVPTVKYVEAIDDGYGRKLGLHSFRSHPIFNSLNGGAYIFNPTLDMKTRQIGFFDESIPQNGKVVAVDWAYITMKEDSRLVVEYKFGKGKILAVGAYTYFAIKNNSRDHLELFTKNCMNYLAGKHAKETEHYWNYKPSQVLLTKMKTGKPIVVASLKAAEWKMDPNSLKLINETATDNYWNVAGQRMLLMGKEKAGIDEIWAHPFMALRDYEIGIVKGDSVSWLKNFQAKVEVRPESFTRNYKLANATLTEIIITSINKPTAIVHYELRGTVPLKLVVRFKSNLRFMWPYSEKTTGSIYYSWNDELNAFVVKDESGDFVSIVGADKKPVDKNIGHFENFDSHFNGISTENSQIAAYSQFNLEPDDNLDIVISSSNEGVQKTIKEYRSAISNPGKVFKSANDYSQKFLDNSLMITTPDKDFNEGYRWALVGTDRFFVNTPGIGKSLVAGYSTTAKGWDGGQKINGRPGYAWYFGRDGVWSSFALLDYGDFEKVKSVLEFFNKYQDLNGKIFHELTTSGAVHYDASDATPLYIILAGKYLQHTGNVEFIKQNWTHIKKAIDFCYSTDTDKDHLIENTNVGHGWVEGGGLYTAHTEVYLAACWSEALNEAGRMAKAIGLNIESKMYDEESRTVKKIINDQFWNKENDFLSFSKMKDGKFNSEKTVLTAVPVYFDMLDNIKAKKVVNAFAENYFSSDWGVRILREDSPIFNPRGYHTGSVWPLFTGWSALAEYKNGNSVQGFTHVMNNLLVYKNWQLGFVEEVLNGSEYKPSGVCSHQAWSETMVLQPAIEGMLGLEVDAQKSILKLSPRFLANWDSAKVERIKIGKALVNFEMKRENGKTIYNFSTNSTEPLTVEFNASFPPGTKLLSHLVVSKSFSIMPLKDGVVHLTFSLNKSSKIVLEHSGEISVLPDIVLPKPNDLSKGFRILTDKLDGNIYSVEVQGKSGSTNVMKVYCSENKITNVENGKIISSDKTVYTIAVEFEKSESKYLNKIVKLKIDR
ncbi:MAG: GH116 family glycosyl hydrolase [Ignavibacteriales bacterium]|nr:GH116 family glycosyl hydrolase [Ignavibacteriales bacterium]